MEGVPRSRHDLLQPCEFVSRGRIPGRLLSLGEYPGVVAAVDPEDWVLGDVYRLQDGTKALVRMDRYEGFVPESSEGCEFRRELSEVRLDSGETVTAWVYYYNLPSDALPRIASGDYRAFASQGSSSSS